MVGRHQIMPLHDFIHSIQAIQSYSMISFTMVKYKIIKGTGEAMMEPAETGMNRFQLWVISLSKVKHDAFMYYLFVSNHMFIILCILSIWFTLRKYSWLHATICRYQIILIHAFIHAIGGNRSYPTISNTSEQVWNHCGRSVTSSNQ